jgi:multimeric flavodoxin WrbA
MKITILNGNPNSGNVSFDSYLDKLNGELDAKGHMVTQYKLREMNIAYCTGCFDCWYKTPGQCRTADDVYEVCQAYIGSDFVLWASPMIMGFYSALLKKVTDKFIGLVCPYPEWVEGEMHHLSRYGVYPTTGLLLEKSEGDDDEDIRITGDIHKRTALNFKSRSAFTRLTSDPLEDVVREIIGLAA